MTQISKIEKRPDHEAEQIARSLQQGVLFVDAEGEVVWMDERTRSRIDGGLSKLHLPLTREAQRLTLDCFITTARVDLEGGSHELCVIQAAPAKQPSDTDVHSIIEAIGEVMAEPSWFTQPLTDKLKARLQADRPVRRISDLARLTARERDILVLVCEGRSDAEMGRILNLSQNTVRNHLASLFKKIGVNRRSAAVIWARERAITKHDVAALTKAVRSGRRSPSDIY